MRGGMKRKVVLLLGCVLLVVALAVLGLFIIPMSNRVPFYTVFAESPPAISSAFPWAICNLNFSDDGETAITLEESARRVQVMRNAMVKINPNILALGYVGPIAQPEGAQYITSHTGDLTAFLGISDIESLATEPAIEIPPSVNSRHLVLRGRGYV